MARFHARRAGVENTIQFAKRNAAAFTPLTENGTIISNPPYAVRMGEKDSVHELYKSIGKALLPLNDFKYYFILSLIHIFRKIDGCYFNVVGLPISKLYHALKLFCPSSLK